MPPVYTALLGVATLFPFGLVGLVLVNGLVPALLAGLLVRETVLLLEPRFQSFGAKARAFTLGALGLALVAGLIAAGLLGYRALAHEGGSALISDMVAALREAKLSAPEWLAPWLPASLPELKAAAVHQLASNAAWLRATSGEVMRTLMLVALGLVIGALSLFQVPPRAPGMLLAAWLRHLDGLATAFSKVVFAQVKISLVNTAMTGVLLVGVLPFFGVQLPFVKTLLVVTFVFGLVPIVGNIASNGVIFLVGLSHSVAVALGLLGYLVLVHTVEHFLNAAIIGKAVRARAVELLPVMLLGETLFGVGGLVTAPILYTWVKTDLVNRNLI